MKNAFDRLVDPLDMTEKKISNLEKMTIETSEIQL